jgi:hypothetical protein
MRANESTQVSGWSTRLCLRDVTSFHTLYVNFYKKAMLILLPDDRPSDIINYPSFIENYLFQTNFNSS